jgi:hypothetical protein
MCMVMTTALCIESEMYFNKIHIHIYIHIYTWQLDTLENEIASSYKRNNVELPPLLKNYVFQKNYFKWYVTVLFALFCYFLTDNNVFTSMILL